jgi:hypothetical protein
MEVATFRERAQAALLQKAQRGALVPRMAIGYVKGADRIEKDPDARVRAVIDLIFRKLPSWPACGRFTSGWTGSRCNCPLCVDRKMRRKSFGSRRDTTQCTGC